jgi:hypothetical protein
VADLGTGIVAIISTSVGGLIAAGAGIAQARTQERIETRRLEHEREAASDARRAADEAELRARERAALIDLGIAVGSYLRGGATDVEVAEIQRQGYQVDDTVLHKLVEMGNYNNGALLRRAGYLLRTEPANRTDDGHQIPGVAGIVVT